jgi:type I restriction enzyme S subunit
MELTKTKYKKTEVGLIPMDWEIKTLGEIGGLKNGINKSAEEFGFGFPFANLMDVFGKSSIANNKHFGLINSNSTERNLYNLKAGDVLFIRSSVKPSGVGITSLIEIDLKDAIFSGFLIRFRDEGLLDINFKKHCFYGTYFRSNVIASSTVSANTNINQQSIKRLFLIIPPTLAEQQAIGTALSDVDELISKLEKLIEKKKAIKQGAMQQLLTPPHKGGKRLEGFSGEWVEKTLGDLVMYKNGKAHENCVVEYGDYIIVNSKFISTDGNVAKYSNDLLCPVNASEILMVLSDVPNGKAIAKCFIVDKDNRYTLNQRICSLKPINTNHLFLYYLINRNPYFLSFDDGAKQTNLRNIDVMNCPLVIPPSKEEQNEIAGIISDMEKEINQLEAKLHKSKALKQGMMQELLTGKTRLV